MDNKLQALVSWAIASGFPKPKLNFEISDPNTGKVIRVDAAWPKGLQEEYSQPIALCLEADEQKKAILNQAGYRFFIGIEAFRKHLKEIFNVLTSSFDRFMFDKFRRSYIPICLLFLGELLIFLSIISQPQAGKFLGALLVCALPMVLIISNIFYFRKFWLKNTRKMLSELFEKSCIYIPNRDANQSYLCFLEEYRNALGSPKRKFLSGFQVIVIGSLAVYVAILHTLSVSVVHLNSFATILFVVGVLLSLLPYLGGFYCLGIETWAVCISGCHVSKLVQECEIRIQPFHTDKCGGLKSLGNFCFNSVVPILFSFGFTIGFIFLLFISGALSVSRIDAFDLSLFVGLPLLLILLYGSFLIVFAFIRPLWDIHQKMDKKRETDEDIYNASIEELREKIQSLLDKDKVEDAKVLQEKKAILETLHSPYPTWPFSFRTKIFSTVLGASGSLLVGMITGALPVILPLLFHNP